MARDRIVVGSLGADDMRAVARRLRDAGHEVVLVGGDQTAEQLLRTAIAEDAARIVVSGGDEVGRLRALCAQLGADAPRVTREV